VISGPFLLTGLLLNTVQLRASGGDQALSPILQVCTDPRFGRMEENFGEDPFLVSQCGVAAVAGAFAPQFFHTFSLRVFAGHLFSRAFWLLGGQLFFGWSLREKCPVWADLCLAVGEAGLQGRDGLGGASEYLGSPKTRVASQAKHFAMYGAGPKDGYTPFGGGPNMR